MQRWPWPGRALAGFALGLDRIVNGLIEQGADPAAAAPRSPQAVVILTAGEHAAGVFAAVRELRRAGHAVSFDTEGRSYKAQHRRAQRLGAASEIVLDAAQVQGRGLDELVGDLLARLRPVATRGPK